MEKSQNPRFPEQKASEKLHGTPDPADRKENNVRDEGKIEMNSKPDKNESTHLTDISGEEKKEDYINTDERKMDIDKRNGL